MDATLLPAGATAMLEIIALVAAAAGGFALWLWRQHCRIRQIGERSR